MGRVATVSVTLLLAGTAWLGAQQRGGQAPQTPRAPAPMPATPPRNPTFRGGATYVEADVVVTDRAGRFVDDLTRDDFTVTEDDQPQAISVFSRVDLPMDAPRPMAAHPVAPDVTTNGSAMEGRLFVLVLDALHVAPANGPRVRAEARQFLTHLGPNDLAAVVHLGSGTPGQDLTSNVDRLTESVDQFAGMKLESETVASQSVFAKSNAGADGTPDDGDTTLRGMRDRQAFRSLGQICAYLGGLRGRRKALLLFSEGTDVNTSAVTGGSRTGAGAAQSVIDAEQDLLAEATAANVSVYPIDPRGLTSGDGTALRLGPDDNLMSTVTSPGGSSIADEITRSRQPLDLLAEATGGLAVLRANDPTAAFDRILQESSTYYLLGYNSTHTKPDGKYRTIAVRLSRPDLTARTRHGYYALKAVAPTGEAADALRELLANPAPVAGLGLRVTAGALRGPPAGVLVHTTLEIDGRTLAFEEKGGLFTDDVDVVYEAVDAGGKVQASQKESLELRLPPAAHDRALAQGVRIVTEFTVPTGRYQLRIAAHERSGGRSGSLLADLDAPDYRKAPLAMSPLFLTTDGADAVPTRGTTSVLAAALPKPTTALRTFTTADVLAYFTEIYDNPVATGHTVEVITTVRDSAGATAIRNVDARPMAAKVAQSAVVDEVTSLPLASLTPGAYTLEVEVRSLLAPGTVRREVPFTVR